jgi:hypothetical protein
MKRIAHTALLLATMALASCSSPGYKREWNAALQTATASTERPIGCWQGTWVSEVNGHSGKLRCVVTPASAGYRFNYQATWAKFFTGEFSIICPATKTGSTKWKVMGSKDLGASMGGTFTHAATITEDQIDAVYNSKIDHGTMKLKRVR